MAKIYASLIIKGVKTLDDVSDRLKEKKLFLVSGVMVKNELTA